jgi:RNA recognition motif. (a.k.a. RRM, RBD, or RNP domain)
VYVSYTTLGQPLPDFALELVFSRYGKVESVHLQSAGRQGIIQFANAKAAAAALAGLGGTKLLGQVCCCQLCHVQHW